MLTIENMVNDIVIILSLLPCAWTDHRIAAAFQRSSMGRTTRKRKPMSVRMALAKLCACTAGGAIVGGGAVHVSEAPAGGPAEVRVTQPRVAARTIGNRPRVHRKTRQVRPVRHTCAPSPTVVTVTNQIATPAPIIPPAPVPIIGELPSFGGGGAPAVIGGGGFFGGGGGF